MVNTNAKVNAISANNAVGKSIEKYDLDWFIEGICEDTTEAIIAPIIWLRIYLGTTDGSQYPRIQKAIVTTGLK